MIMEEPIIKQIEDLSFEDLTFGGENFSTTGKDFEIDQDSPQKIDRDSSGSSTQKNKSGIKKDKRPKSDKSDRHAVLISTKGDKINLAILLKQLEECGPVRAHHFRERQNFGFVQFLDSESADNAIEKLNNRDIDGQMILVERIKRITPGKDPRIASVGSPQCSSLPTTLPSMIENKPDSTLVLKNLPFNLKQVQLQEILESINPSAPQSVNFHYDNIGVFRGMAFVKYRLVEDAVKVFEVLNGADVHGRRVRLEYKRKVSKSSEIPSEVLEDEQLRKVWEQLKDFKEDPNSTEINFSSFTGVQRMYIHNMAEKLKLTHTSTGEEPNRSIIVTNKKPVVGTPGKEDSILLSSSPLINMPPASSSSLSTTPTSMAIGLGSNSYNSGILGSRMKNNSHLSSNLVGGLSSNNNNNLLSPNNNGFLGISNNLNGLSSIGGGNNNTIVNSNNNSNNFINIHHQPSPQQHSQLNNNNTNNNSSSTNNYIGFNPLLNDSKIGTSPVGGSFSSAMTIRGFGVRDRSYSASAASEDSLSSSPVGIMWPPRKDLTSQPPPHMTSQHINILNPNNTNNHHHPSPTTSNHHIYINNTNNSNLTPANSFNLSNSININKVNVNSNNSNQQQQQQSNSYSGSGNSNSFNMTYNSPININNPNLNNNNNQSNNLFISPSNNSFNLVSSPILRQPKGPDGTKGFSDIYKSTRKLGQSPLPSPSN
eukprot:gene1321-1667_t